MANCAGPYDLVQHKVSPIATQLHLSGQRQQSFPHKTNHQISIQKHYAGSNTVMCGHIQATIRRIHGLGNPKLHPNPKTHRDNIHSNPQADGTMQNPHEVAMRNGKLSAGSKRRTLGVPPPHCKPNHKIHLAALIWNQNQMPYPGNAGAQHWH
jgi:hypothetical protein